MCGLSSPLRSAAVKGVPSSSGAGEELELQGAPWHSQAAPTMSPAELQCFRDRREEANNQLAQTEMPGTRVNEADIAIEKKAEARTRAAARRDGAVAGLDEVRCQGHEWLSEATAHLEAAEEKWTLLARQSAWPSCKMRR